MNEKDKINKEFDTLLKSYSSKGPLLKDENQYKNLLDWASKNDNLIKRTDYGYYAIVFLIVILVLIILLIMYYTERVSIAVLDDLIKSDNESPFIEIEEYENEFIE